MDTFISQSTPKARKEYGCDACYWLLYDWIPTGVLTFAERRAIVKAKRNKWKIQKGEIYLKVVQVGDGRMYSFRAIPEIDNICQKHNLYPDD